MTEQAEETVVYREQVDKALAELWEIIGPKDAIDPEWDDEATIKAAADCVALLASGDKITLETKKTLIALEITVPEGVITKEVENKVATKKVAEKKAVEPKKAPEKKEKAPKKEAPEKKEKAPKKEKVVKAVGENPYREGSMRNIAWQGLKDGKTSEEIVKLIMKKYPEVSEKNAKRKIGAVQT